MVLGSILNWVVGKTLDFTLYSILWATKKTGQGVLSLGYYVTSINSTTNTPNTEETQLLELIPLTKVEIEMLREQNNILKEELAILKKLNPDLTVNITKETNIDSLIQENKEKEEEKEEEKEVVEEKEEEVVEEKEVVEEEEIKQNSTTELNKTDSDSDSFV